MNIDFNKLADYIKECKQNGQNWTMPAMKISEIIKLIDLVEA